MHSYVNDSVKKYEQIELNRSLDEVLCFCLTKGAFIWSKIQ